MFIISKNTFDTAEKGSFELTLEEGLTPNGSLLVCFWEKDQEDEGCLAISISATSLRRIVAPPAQNYRQ